MTRLRQRPEWQFFAALRRAHGTLGTVWWVVLVAQGVLPAIFAIATGVLVSAVQGGRDLTGSLIFAGTVFVLLQVLAPVHTAISANLGDTMSAWLNDRLGTATVAPPGIGHLEDETFNTDLTVARDFDLGMTGPPLSISMDFIASGLMEMLIGVVSAAILAAYAW